MAKDDNTHPNLVMADEKPIGDEESNANEQNIAEWTSMDKKIDLKLDLFIIPLVTIVYLLAFLDRANVGNARVAGLQADLKLTDHQYQTAITVTYVPYIALEIPSNLIIEKIGPKTYIPLLCVSWGIVSTLQCLVHSYAGFVACRFFLGLAEGGLFPGIILYLSNFYRRRQLSLRIALFWSAASLSGAFSGVLAAGISKMDGVGNLEGWRWIFALEGIFTVCWGAFTYFMLPNNAKDARVLSVEERTRCIERLKLDGDLEEDEKVTVQKVFSVFKDPHIFLVWLASLCSGFIIFGLAYFTPSIVLDMGFSPIRTQLMSVPPYAFATVLTVAVCYFSDRYASRGVPMLITYFISLAGVLMFYIGRSLAVRYTGLFLLLGGVYANAPVLIAWVPNNTAAKTRRATAIAGTCIAVNTGGIVSTWIFPTSDAPYYPMAAILMLSGNLVAIVVTALTMWVCQRANRKKDTVEYRQAVLGELEHLEFREQFAIVGDKHPDYKYVL